MKLFVDLSAWLQTGPGLFTGPTATDAIHAAYEAFPLKKKYTEADFAEVLELAGYRCQQRTRHGDGEGQQYSALALPEAFAGL